MKQAQNIIEPKKKNMLKTWQQLTCNLRHLSLPTNKVMPKNDERLKMRVIFTED